MQTKAATIRIAPRIWKRPNAVDLKRKSTIEFNGMPSIVPSEMNKGNLQGRVFSVNTSNSHWSQNVSGVGECTVLREWEKHNTESINGQTCMLLQS